MSDQSINPFPLGIGSKQNSFEKLQLMANVPNSFKVTAQEFNIIISALNFLYNNNGTGEVPLSGVKILEIGRAWIGGAGSNRQIAADSINAGASFSVPSSHIGIVRFHSGIPLQGFPSRFTYFAIKTGAGTYGSGGTQLNASNVVEVNTVFENIETVFNLGNITTNAIDFFANNSGPYIVQDVAKFTATQNDIEKEWLFIGGSGTWGTGAQQTNAEMFLDLADQDPIPVEQIPPVPITRATLSDLLQDMNAGNLIKDFIYRSEADGYFHFKGLSDTPFSGDLVPIATGGGGGGQVDSVTGLLPIEVDNSDPTNPIVRLQEQFQNTVNSALQPGDNVSELVILVQIYDSNEINYINFPASQFGTSILPRTGNLTQNIESALRGQVQKIYHDDSVEPTYPATWRKAGEGEYLTDASVDSKVNVIYVEFETAGRQVYWIVQEIL